jgi:hypothetical protein
MLLLKTSPAFAYAKVDKMDAEEARRVRAQYLIHRVLEGSVPAARSTRSKARVGVRLKKLRLAVRGVRLRACRTVQRHLRTLRRLLLQGSGDSLPA